MSRLQIFLLRWIADAAFRSLCPVQFFAVIREVAEERFYEDNRVTVDCYLREQMAASGPKGTP